MWYGGGIKTYTEKKFLLNVTVVNMNMGCNWFEMVKGIKQGVLSWKLHRDFLLIIIMQSIFMSCCSPIPYGEFNERKVVQMADLLKCSARN